MPEGLGLALLLFVAAVLYTSVGHAGASGYLAAFALYELDPERMRPAALVLNLCAAVLTAGQFWRAGYFDRNLFYPLIVGSVPAAFVGGLLTLPGDIYKPILGSALVIAAVRLAWPNFGKPGPFRTMPEWTGLALGAVIGLVSGLTGVGGGIYLTPVLLFAGWAETKTAAGVSATFILVNSAAGLAGMAVQGKVGAGLPPDLPVWGAVVIGGSLIGSTLGSRVFASPTIRRVLAVVLLIAAAKLFFGDEQFRLPSPPTSASR